MGRKPFNGLGPLQCSGNLLGGGRRFASELTPETEDGARCSAW